METVTQEEESRTPRKGRGRLFEETVEESSHRMSWGAIFGGAITSLAVGMLLYSLGLALGLTAFDLEQGLQGTGIFTGIWGIVTALLALFVGGMVAGRGAGRITKLEGGLHGLVMWGVTALAGVWLLVNLVATLVGGAAAVGGQLVGQAGPVMQAVGIDSQAMLEPINQQLRAAGQPELTPEEFEAATNRAVQEGIRTGTFDRQTIVTALSEETQLTVADAQVVAAEIEGELQAVMAAAPGVAADVATRTGEAFWAIFGALLLGLLAAVFGAMVGARPRDLTPTQRQSKGDGQRRTVFKQPHATS